MKMKNLIFILIFLSSCFGSPVDQKDDKEKELVILWQYVYEVIGFPEAPPLVSGDKVYMSGDQYLTQLRKTDGSASWRTLVDTERPLRGQKFLHHEEQVAAVHDGVIKGWNKVTGEQVWEYIYSDSLEPRRNGNIDETENGYVFSALNSKLFILSQNGELLLEKQLDNAYSVMGVSYANGKFYLGQRNTVNGALTLGRITALDAQKGDSLWAFDTDQGGFTWAAPIVEDGIVYAGSIGNSEGEIAIALNAETGEEIWRQTEFIWTFNSALGPDHFYINTSGSLAALDKKTGNIDWRAEWSSSAHSSPVYLAGYVYFTNYSELMVINDETGEVVHREPVPDVGGFFWHLAVSKDKLFAQTSSQLIAYQPWHLREE